MPNWLADGVSSPVPRKLRRVAEIAIILLTITFYPFGPRLVRLVWRATHDKSISYAGACIPVQSQWFTYQTHAGPILVRVESVFARNMFDLGYAQVSAADEAISFDKYREGIKTKANSEVFSHDGVEVVCSDWYESSERFVNSCFVRGKMNITFSGPTKFRNDFRDLVHTITACSTKTEGGSSGRPLVFCTMGNLSQKPPCNNTVVLRQNEKRRRVDSEFLVIASIGRGIELECAK